MSSEASHADRVRSVLDSAVVAMGEKLASSAAPEAGRKRRLPRRVAIAAEPNNLGVLHAMEGPRQASGPAANPGADVALPAVATASRTAAKPSESLGEALAHWCFEESRAGGAKVEDTVRSVALMLRRGGALAAALNDGRVAPRRLASAAVRGELGSLQQMLVDADESQLRAPTTGLVSNFFVLGPVLRTVAAFLGPRSLCRLGATSSHLSRVCASNPLWDVLLERDFARGRQPAIVEAWADDVGPQRTAAEESPGPAGATVGPAAPLGLSAPKLPSLPPGAGNCPSADAAPAADPPQRRRAADSAALGQCPAPGPMAGVSARLQRLLLARGGSRGVSSASSAATARRIGDASGRRPSGPGLARRATKRRRDDPGAPAETQPAAARAKRPGAPGVARRPQPQSDAAGSPERRTTAPDVPGWELGCATAASTSAVELRSRGERSVVAYQRLWGEWDRQRRLRDIAPLTACPRCGEVAMDLRSVQSGMAVGSYRRCLACRNVVVTAYSRPDTRMFAGAFMGSV